jgi:hypothetical protein
MTVRASELPFSLDLLIAEAKRRMRRRRALAATVVALVAAGVAGGILAARSPGSMGGAQAAQALRQHLGSVDRYVCSTTKGAPNLGGEPNWTYLCLNATRRQLPGYFLLTRGNRITKIQPAG